MTERAKEIMGVETIAAAADTGYYDGEDIEKCEQNGTITHIAKNSNDNKHAPNENYDKKHFKYDTEKDCYICPQGEILPFRHLQKPKNTTYENRVYYDNRVCKNCLNRGECTISKKGGRHINRSKHQDALDRNNARMSENYDIFKERKKIVEHPFGTTKAVWGYKQYLCRGRERTAAEQSLAFLAYNFRRVINIFKESGRNLAVEMG
jgi:hypothetical protein